jgi:hypothetical protein
MLSRFGRTAERDKVTAAHARPKGSLIPAPRLGPETGLFFLLFYLYVWLVIDPRLIGHSLGILAPYHPFSFSTGWPFFWEHLSRWGGLVEYGDRLLSLLLCSGWMGSLIAATTALLTCLYTDVLVRCAGGARGRLLRYVPAVVLLAVYGQYIHTLRPVLSLLVAISGFVLYLRLAPEGAARRFAVFLVTWGAVCYVAGVGGILFAVLVAVFELLLERRLVAGGLTLCLALVAIWATREMLVGVDFDRTHSLFPGSELGTPPRERPYAIVLFLFFPALLVLEAFKRTWLAGWATKWIGRLAPKTEPSRNREEPLVQSKWTRILTAVAVFSAASIVAWLWLDMPSRTVLLTDYYAQHEMWPEALDAAHELPFGMYHPGCNRNVMLALFHTGRLADEMFHYPQTPRLEFFSISEERKEAHSYLQESRVLLALGQVNRAERFACEAIEGSGDLPAVLKLLAIINVVKDRPQTAELFLNALAKNPLHRRTAERMLRRIRSDPRLEDDPDVSGIRQVMTGTDSVKSDVDVEELLQVLLVENPDNKMAFEFLMAHYLCIGRLDMVVANLDRLEDFGYGTIPRHYQEAIIVHANTTEGRRPTDEFLLDPEIIERGKRFSEILTAAPTRGAAAQAALSAGFGDSYFFYFTYGVSGL